MNILSNSLKTNFVSTMCPTQKMQFHHSSSSPTLKNLIGNNGLPPQNPYRTFNNPNIFKNQGTFTHHPSNYNKKINHFEVAKKVEFSNSSDMILTTDDNNIDKTDFEVKPSNSPLKSQYRKRRRKGSKNRFKTPEKHNTNRQVVNEMMDLELELEPEEEVPLTNDEEMEDNNYCCEPGKLSDVIVIPKHSSPIDVPQKDFSPKISAQTGTCIAFSISPPNMRQRQISVTESEDSFIVFDSGTDEECDFSDEACSDTDEDESSSSESDQEECEDDDIDIDSPGSVIPTKKVRFADDKELCEIHPMIQWSFAYQAARKGPWKIYARDRERFRNKITNIGESIMHCLEPEHRQKIFDQRFKENSLESGLDKI